VGTFSFRSVGKTLETTLQDARAVEPTPTMYGVKTPLRPGIKNVFDVTYSLKDQIADNLRNLLLTNHGERVGLYDYGANLRPVLTEFVSLDDFDSTAIERIKKAVDKWMPYINLNDFTSKVDRTKNNGKIAAISLMITYDVPALQITNASIKLTMFVP